MIIILRDIAKRSRVLSHNKVLIFGMMGLSVISVQCNTIEIKSMKLTSKLPTWHLEDKRVFLRADLNVPLIDQTIANDFRLRALLPTLNYVIKHEGSVILATHIGRPPGYDPDLSTKVLLPWFKERGYDIIFTENIEHASTIELKPQQILLLENLRFFPGEKGKDPLFAKQLAQLAEYYVNDAFGTSHRTDTSVTLTAQEFHPQHRTIGFLIERELMQLNNMLEDPDQPFIALLGGGKISDKIPLMYGMLNKTQIIILCPAIVFTFLKAMGKPVGKSLIDDQALETCKKIVALAKSKNVNLIFPVDYQIAHKSVQGPLSIIDANSFPGDGVGISIGPKTVELLEQEINQARTIFFNAAMGFGNRSETLKSTHDILQIIAQARGTSVIAGGDSVAAAQQIGMEDSFDHLSTGGGATLSYLSGQPLPSLQIFEND